MLIISAKLRFHVVPEGYAFARIEANSYAADLAMESGGSTNSASDFCSEAKAAPHTRQV
jgi:hypothetical protein